MGDLSMLHYDLLSDEDLKSYYKLKDRLCSQKFAQVDTFPEVMRIIKKWCIRNDESDTIRCAVCGMFWFCHGIAINKRNLRLLTGKPKTTLSRCIASLEYHIATSSISTKLLKEIPFFRDFQQEIRFWSYRATTEKYSLAPDDQLIKEINVNCFIKEINQERVKEQSSFNPEYKQQTYISSKRENASNKNSAVAVYRKPTKPPIELYLEDISTWSCWTLDLDDDFRFRPEP